MTWYFEEKQIEELPEDCVGFVYLITNKTNDRKYVGKKLAKFSRTQTKTVTLKNGTKKKRRSDQRLILIGKSITVRV